MVFPVLYAYSPRHSAKIFSASSALAVFSSLCASSRHSAYECAARSALAAGIADADMDRLVTPRPHSTLAMPGVPAISPHTPHSMPFSPAAFAVLALLWGLGAYGSPAWKRALRGSAIVLAIAGAMCFAVLEGLVLDAFSREECLFCELNTLKAESVSDPQIREARPQDAGRIKGLLDEVFQTDNEAAMRNII